MKNLTSLFSIALIGISSVGWASTGPIPCTVGNKWEFDSVKMIRGHVEYKDQKIMEMFDTSSGKAVYEVTSVNNGVFQYKETTNTKSTVSGRSSAESTEMKMTKDGDELKVLDTISSAGEGDPDVQKFDPPLLYWIKDAAKGKSWDVGMLHSSGGDEPLSAKIVGTETVTVLAGTFKDCTKVVYTSSADKGSLEMMGQKFAITSAKSVGIYWIADGIGVVKELEIATQKSQAPGPVGGFAVMEGSTCTINELRPGYIVK